VSQDTIEPEEGRALGQASSQAPDLNWLVTDFTERLPAVEHAAVVSSDGVPLAVSDGIPPDRLEHLSAITAGLISLARGTASMFEGGAVTQTLVTMARGVLVIVAISDGSSLAVLAAMDADLDLVAYEMTVLAEQAGSVLTPDPRPPRAGQQA
jgi:predicted regulator of Ras-like GTPase activity (Roadblock/LC7/MglB family)